MRDMKIRKMVLAALMAALTYVATMVVQIPSPMQGYVNLGDCCVLLSGWILGPWWGGAAAGIGSMLTDLLNGYAHYAPGTLVIKALDAIVAAALAANPAVRLCISAIALETLQQAVAALTARGLTAQVTQIAVSRTKPAGRLHLLMANNPIFLITGERK